MLTWNLIWTVHQLHSYTGVLLIWIAVFPTHLEWAQTQSLYHSWKILSYLPQLCIFQGCRWLGGGHWWGEAQGICSLAWHLFLCHCSAVPWEPSTISDVLDGIARFSFLVQRTWEVSRQVLCEPSSRISLGVTASPNPLLPSFCLSTKVVRGSRTVRIQLKNQMCRFNSSLNSI